MNKADLVKIVAEKTGLSQAQTGKAINAFLEAVEDALKKNERVAFVGFGTFKVAYRKGKKGRNPRTKEEITIPPRNVVRFIPGKKLKEEIPQP